MVGITDGIFLKDPNVTPGSLGVRSLSSNFQYLNMLTIRIMDPSQEGLCTGDPPWRGYSDTISTRILYPDKSGHLIRSLQPIRYMKSWVRWSVISLLLVWMKIRSFTSVGLMEISTGFRRK